MKALATLFPLRAMANNAQTFVEYALDRWDVPKGDWVPQDLRDENPNLPFTADKKAVSSLLLPEDYLDRSDYNPVALLCAGAFPLAVCIGALGGFAKNLGLMGTCWTAAVALAAFASWLLAQNAIPTGKIVKAAFVGFLLPIVGFAISTGGSVAGAIPANAGNAVLRLMQGWPSAVALITLLALWIASFFTPYAKEPMTKVFYIIVGIGTFALAAAVAKPLCFPIAIAFAVYCPWSMFKAWRKERAQALYTFASAYAGETVGKNNEAHIIPRREQAEAAARDTSPLIKIGKASGVLSARNDHYAPDAGKDIVISGKDTSTHLIIIGEIGSGKTRRCIIPFTVQWMAKNCGGVCVYDGKYDLAMKFAKVPGFQVITPNKYDHSTQQLIEKGVTLGLIQRVQPGLVTETIASATGVHHQHSAAQGSAEYFKNMALVAGRFSEIFLHWLRVTELHVRKQGLIDRNTPRRFFWTVAGVHSTAHLIVDRIGLLASDTRPREVLKWTEWLREFCPVPLDRNPLLAAAIEWIEIEVPNLAERQNEFGAIVSSFDQYYQPLLQNRDLLDWCNTEEGEVDVCACLHGAWMGVFLPTLTYGNAGRMAQALIRKQQASEGRQRSDDFRAKDPTATACLIVMDEATELMVREDLAIGSMGRSQEIYLLAATQSWNAMIETFGENGAKIAESNFLSTIMFRANETSFGFIQKRLGTSVRPKTNATAARPNIDETLRRIANSPVNDWGYAFGQDEMERLASRDFAMPKASHSANDGGDYVKAKASLDGFQFPLMQTAGDFEERPLVDQSDFHALSKGDGYALVTVMRGGKARRDFCRLPAMGPEDINPEWFAWKQREIEATA